MGNQVVFSIREDNLEEVANASFERLSNKIHKGIVPCFSDPLQQAILNDIDLYDLGYSVQGVAFSSYHHNTGGACVYVRHDMISDQVTLFGVDEQALSQGDVAEIVKKSKNDSRFMLGIDTNERFSYRISQKTDSINEYQGSPSHRYHVFGYLTDCTHELERNDNLMSELVDYIRGGRETPPSRIKAIGRYEPDQGVLVKLEGNVFYPSAPFSARGTDPGEDLNHFITSRGSIPEDRDDRSAWRKVYEDISTWSAKYLMKDLGYSMTPYPAKQRKHEPPGP